MTKTPNIPDEIYVEGSRAEQGCGMWFKESRGETAYIRKPEISDKKPAALIAFQESFVDFEKKEFAHQGPDTQIEEVSNYTFTKEDEQLIEDALYQPCEPNPHLGDGRIWDGQKWLHVAPSMETYEMLNMRNDLKKSAGAWSLIRIILDPEQNSCLKPEIEILNNAFKLYGE